MFVIRVGFYRNNSYVCKYFVIVGRHISIKSMFINNVLVLVKLIHVMRTYGCRYNNRNKRN